MNALEELASLCAAGVTVTINDHRSVYHSVEEWLSDDDFDVSPEVRAEMIRRDRTVLVQYYPNTPVGFCAVAHYDITAAVEEALEHMRGGK